MLNRLRGDQAGCGVIPRLSGYQPGRPVGEQAGVPGVPRFEPKALGDRTCSPPGATHDSTLANPTPVLLRRHGGKGLADHVVRVVPVATVSAIGPSLEGPRRDAMLSVDEFWVRYVGNGRTASSTEFLSFVADDRWPGTLQYNIAVSALNDRFSEMDLDRPIPYAIGD